MKSPQSLLERFGFFGESTGIVDFENHTSHPSVGDVLFYPGGFSETELLIRLWRVQLCEQDGAPFAGNHFMSIVEVREHLPALGRTVLWHGAQEVMFDWERAA